MCFRKEGRDCLNLLLMIFTTVLLLLVLLIVVHIITYNEFKLNDCHVNEIYYPELTPQENSSFWKKCDCGKRCWAHSPVIDIYVNVINVNQDLYLLKKKINYDYTFHNSSCKRGERLDTIHIFINNARAIKEKYTNKTLDCYYNGENVLIEKKEFFEDPDIIIFMIAFIVISICTACSYWDYCSDKKQASIN